MASELQGLMSYDNIIKNYIKLNEGYDSNIYKDTKKIPTTGYGFNIKSEHIKKLIPTDVLSGKRSLKEQEANEIFEKVYTQSLNDAKQFVGEQTFNALPNEKKQVLIDMSYNMGLTKLNEFKNMKKALQSNDMQTARKELLDSNYAREDVPTRAMRNANLLSSESQGLSGLISQEVKSTEVKKNEVTKSEFNKAFATARKAGKKIFEFNGKKYTTEIKK